MASISHSLKVVALVSASSAAAALLVQACGGGSVAQAVGLEIDPIVGVWSSDAVLKDCATGATLGGFKGYGMFNHGGTGSADNARPPATKAPAMATWKRNDDGSYSINLIFMRFNPDGTFAGTQKGRVKRSLSADGNSYTSTITGEMLDAAGVVVGSYCASDSGTRVAW